MKTSILTWHAPLISGLSPSSSSLVLALQIQRSTTTTRTIPETRRKLRFRSPKLCIEQHHRREGPRSVGCNPLTRSAGRRITLSPWERE
jgi:hypothetical protein